MPTLHVQIRGHHTRDRTREVWCVLRLQMDETAIIILNKTVIVI